MLTDLAVMLADGGRGISGLAVLRDRPELFGAVASTATAWRVLDSIDGPLLDAVRAARAAARERLWAQRAQTVGPIPDSRAGGRDWPGLQLIVDAALVTCHRAKELASATFKGGFGYHPLTVWLDNTSEALAAVLRTGKAGSNTTADHIAVTDLLLAQLPDAHRHGTPILVSADGAGATRDWLSHLRSQREAGVDLRFSVGSPMTDTVQTAILALPEQAWTAAIEADGSARGADVAELTGLLPHLAAAGWPGRDAGDRAPGATAPRRAAALHRRGRLAVPDLCHRHPYRAARPAEGPAPRARPRPGPVPVRHSHRAELPAVPPVREQPGVAGTDPDRL